MISASEKRKPKKVAREELIHGSKAIKYTRKGAPKPNISISIANHSTSARLYVSECLRPNTVCVAHPTPPLSPFPDRSSPYAPSHIPSLRADYSRIAFPCCQRLSRLDSGSLAPLGRGHYIPVRTEKHAVTGATILGDRAGVLIGVGYGLGG